MIASERADDGHLDPLWLAAMYFLSLIPSGGFLLTVGSSVAYYRLRRSRPALARSINRHGFVALALWIGVMLLRRKFGH